MKIAKKIIDEWVITFRTNKSKNVFSRNIINMFATNNISIYDLQTYINTLLVMPIENLTKNDNNILNTYNMLKLERKYAIEEDLSDSSMGMLHLSKSQLGNNEKQEIKVETENISDILKNEED